MAYQKLGNFDDAYIKKTSAGAYGQIQAAKSAWQSAKTAGDQAGMTAAYQAAEQIHFDNMHYRKDIGRRAMEQRGE